MNLFTAVCLILLFGFSYAVLFFRSNTFFSQKEAGSTHGIVLGNSVTHSRYLPKESSHSFTYPTVSLLVSLQHLEENKLDCGAGGWLFGYGSLFRLCGLRSQPYLTHLMAKHGQLETSASTIREKLNRVLFDRGWDVREVNDVWFATMPSFLGFEGVNPLSVYYLYKEGKDQEKALWLVVLEVRLLLACVLYKRLLINA
jgi:DUF1365 family protein